MFTWITKFADSFFTAFLEDRTNMSAYLTTYHARLRKSYMATSNLLKRYGIPFQIANSGMFIWIDLSPWLLNFGNESEKSATGTEMKLTLWLLKQGVYLEPGKVSSHAWLCWQNNALIKSR